MNGSAAMRPALRAVLPLALVVLVLGVLLISGASAAPTVTTDKADYFFLETVTISGGGFAANTSYDVPVIRPDGSIVTGDGTETPGWDTVLTDGSGAFTYAYQLWTIAGLYEVRVYPSPWSGNLAEAPTASVTFTDSSPGITLEQCRNGTAAAPEDCVDNQGSGWVTGNVGDQQSHLVEGYSVPYRAVMENLPTSFSITLTLGYDIKHSSAHALDFLTHYDRLEPHGSFTPVHSAETVTPTDGIIGIAGITTTFAIPEPSSTSLCTSPVLGQPTTSFNSLPAGERLMTLFGGTITAIAYTTTPPQGCLTDATAETQIEVTFTVDSATAVLSWGGHIGRALDWGAGNSAGGISGSPYHMRLIDWNLGNVGNQDRSLSAGTVEPAGKIVIVKDTVGGDDTFSFTATPDGIPSVFDITTSGGTGSQTFDNITAGTKTVTESGPPAGWSFTSLTCDDPDSGTTVSGQTATIDLDSGETVTCTFTNTKLPTLTLVKTVVNDDGGTAVVADFPLFIDGSPVTSGVANTVNVGPHTASETTQTGYAASAWGGDCAANGAITLVAGQNATCTITNDDIPPQLTVCKEVINDNGGTAAPSDFTMTVTATNPNPASFPGDAACTLVSLDAGSYSVSESGPSGYAESQSADCSGTIAIGDNKTCTIINDDIAPTLTIVKTVVNDDGGTKVVADFPLFIDGGPVTSGVANTVTTGAHTASETTQAGYAASLWGGDCNTLGNVSLALGENKTCTIINDDIAPTLTIVKTVVNDDGGTKVVADFPLFIDAGPVTSGVANTVTAGAHTASETTQAGYAASSWGGDCDSLGNVSLALGDVKTCTITNDDIAPTLTLVKTVVNDDGGTKVVADFPLFIDGGPVTSGVANAVTTGLHTASETTQAGYAASLWGGDCNPDGTITIALGENKTCTITNDDVGPTLTLVKTVVNDDGGTKVVADFPLFIDGGPVTSGVANAVTAGAHTASETTQAGYAASTWGGDCNTDGTITLALGENKTCTITNDDVGPTLTITKTVVNDDGGTKVVSDFPLFIDGGPVTSGVANTVTTGAHTASETTQAGYAASTWGGDCNPDGTITLTPGQNATCTIINDDVAAIPATLIVIKQVINDSGGTNVAGDFTMTINGVTATGGNSFPGEESPGTEKTVTTGSYNVSEIGPSGYTQSKSPDCTGTIAAGETKTCTITNDDGPPPVGGVVELRVASGGGASSESPGDGAAMSLNYLLLTLGIAAGTVIAGAGAWYARRRSLK